MLNRVTAYSVIVILFNLLLVSGPTFVNAFYQDEEVLKTLLVYNFVTGEEAVKNKIVDALKNVEKAKKIVAGAQKLNPADEKKLNGNAYWVLARIAQELRENDAAVGFYNKFLVDAKNLGSGQKMAAGYGPLIQILFDAKKYKECEKLCSEFLDITLEDEAAFIPIIRLKPVVFRRMVLCQSRLGEIDKAIERVEKLYKDQPDNWLNLELKARILREAGRISDAEKTYQDLIAKIDADKRLEKEEKEEFLEEIKYTLSNVYVELKKIDKAAEILKALVEKNPDNPTYHNDLGYIWADNDLNLEEAEKLIRKAIEIERGLRKKIKNLKPEFDKDNSAYLDSLAWVLYKKKDYAEAKKLLLEAIKDEEGQHIEIMDHLGDIHSALGEKAEAVKVWKDALNFAGTSKREQDKKKEVEKKIEKNK
jgi:tetratricopeptide (TPR) repeat protein